MVKKPKKPEKINGKSNGDPTSVSGSSNIFKTLFGAIPQEQSSVSIFSDDNPFRRKPSDRSQPPNQQQQQQQQQKQEVGLGLGSAEHVGNATNGEGENPNVGEAKKRKRNKEKKPSLDSGLIDETSETQLEIKKSKRGEPKGSNFGLEAEERDETDTGNLGFDSKESLKPGKGKKTQTGSCERP